jgi:Flagellar hook-length control protein FliK
MTPATTSCPASNSAAVNRSGDPPTGPPGSGAPPNAPPFMSVLDDQVARTAVAEGQNKTGGDAAGSPTDRGKGDNQPDAQPGSASPVDVPLAVVLAGGPAGPIGNALTVQPAASRPATASPAANDPAAAPAGPAITPRPAVMPATAPPAASHPGASDPVLAEPAPTDLPAPPAAVGEPTRVTDGTPTPADAPKPQSLPQTPPGPPTNSSTPAPGAPGSSPAPAAATSAPAPALPSPSSAPATATSASAPAAPSPAAPAAATVPGAPVGSPGAGSAASGASPSTGGERQPNGFGERAQTPTPTPTPTPASASAAGTAPTTPPITPPAPTATAPAAPAQPAALPARVDLAHLIEQTRATIAMAVRQGSSQASMQISPASLGSIRIHLQTTAQGLIARLIADHPDAAQTLQQGGGDLRRSLQETGLPLLQLDIGTSDGRHLAGRDEFTTPAGSGPSAGPADNGDPRDTVTTDPGIADLDPSGASGRLVDLLA